jgi:hypothetical protein
MDGLNAAAVGEAVAAARPDTIVNQMTALSETHAGKPKAGARLGAAVPLVAAGLREGGRMSRTEEFEELRPLLFSIAYRILGSVAEAEDAVQESWLRYESTQSRPNSPKAYLSAVVTRIAIDVLRSARARRETYVGP